MNRIGIAVAATGLVFATVAFGQGNVPPSQDLCSMGFEKADKAGMMGKISKETMMKVDTNKDGKVSKAEFDSACSKKLFSEPKG